LFVIPHNAGPGELARLAAESNVRTVAGLLMIFVGLVAASAAGFRLGAGRRNG
jgi:5-formyltetrahydrofolate cyclo-ligase